MGGRFPKNMVDLKKKPDSERPSKEVREKVKGMWKDLVDSVDGDRKKPLENILDGIVWGSKGMKSFEKILMGLDYTDREDEKYDKAISKIEDLIKKDQG